MLLRTACLLLIACAWATPGLGQPVETIDLRVKSARTVSPCGHETMRGSARRDSKTEVPVEVSLLELDRDSYNYFDVFTYRVAVKNTGTVPLVLPRQRTAPVVVNGPAGCETTQEEILYLLQLRVRLAGTEHVANTIVLGAGANEVGRVMRLAPGQTVEFIAGGRWDFVPPVVADEVQQQLPATLQAVAALVLGRSPQVKGAGTSLSTNSLPINLLPFQRAHLKPIGPR